MIPSLVVGSAMKLLKFWSKVFGVSTDWQTYMHSDHLANHFKMELNLGGSVFMKGLSQVVGLTFLYKYSQL